MVERQILTVSPNFFRILSVPFPPPATSQPPLPKDDRGTPSSDPLQSPSDAPLASPWALSFGEKRRNVDALPYGIEPIRRKTDLNVMSEIQPFTSISFLGFEFFEDVDADHLPRSSFFALKRCPESSPTFVQPSKVFFNRMFRS